MTLVFHNTEDQKASEHDLKFQTFYSNEDSNGALTQIIQSHETSIARVS